MPQRLSLVVRFGALLSAGAFGVHQLRYLLAYGEQAGGALHATGHGYLAFLEPALGVLLAFAVGQVVATVARGGGGAGACEIRLRRRALAAAFAVALLAIFTGQELIEGALNPGHPAGLEGVVGNGGWVAAPLAMVLGTVLAWTVRLVGRAGERVRLRAVVRPPACPAAPVSAAFPPGPHRPAAPAARRRPRGPPLLATA